MTVDLPKITVQAFTQKIIKRMTANESGLTLEKVWSEVESLQLDKKQVVLEFVKRGILEPKKEEEIDETEYRMSLYRD